MSEAEPLGLFLARVSNDQSRDPYRRRILPEAVADGAARHRFGRRGRRRQGDRTAAFPSRGARGRRAPRRVGVAPRSGPGRARPPTRGAGAFAACRHRPHTPGCAEHRLHKGAPAPHAARADGMSRAGGEPLDRTHPEVQDGPVSAPSEYARSLIRSVCRKPGACPASWLKR